MSYSLYDLNTRISNLQAAVSGIIPLIPALRPGAPNELIVVDTIVVADVYPAPNNTTTTTPTGVVCLDVTIPTSSSRYELGAVQHFFTGGFTSSFDYQLLQIYTPFGTTQCDLTSSSLLFTDGVTTNTLDLNNWSGNINSVNTVANLTHYLGFFDSSATGNGKPQKTAGLSCNPATNTITATTFSGNATSSTSAVGVNLTSDNTAGTYFLPFSKTATATGNALFVDNSTTPLTYDPNASSLTCSNFLGASTTAVGVNLTGDNTNGTYYIPFSKTATATGNALFIDSTTTVLSYNPNLSTLTVDSLQLATATAAITSFSAGVLTLPMSNITNRNFNWVLTGVTNTLTTLTLTSSRLNGVYTVGILNNGSGALTLNTGLGANIVTKYTVAVVIPAGSLAIMNIQILSINSVVRTIVDAYAVA